LNSGKGKRFSLLQNHSDRLWDSNRLLTNGCRGTFRAVKRSALEVHHSTPSKAEIKNECSYTSARLILLHGVEGDNRIEKWGVGFLSVATALLLSFDDLRIPFFCDMTVRHSRMVI
jgi:hypothetical protein